MHLIVGLGNPGKEYENTRHNIGFMILDQLQKSFNFEDFHQEKKFQAMITEGNFLNQKVILCKPLTFMNLSGEAVSKILQFYKIPPENCLVVYDDIDLSLGQLRLRKKGSAGTHNGMKSTVQLIGENFPRLRLGIESRGVIAPAKQETASFVLSPFLTQEQELIKMMTQKAMAAVEIYLSEGIEKAMNKVN